MLPIVARSATAIVETPGPKNSTNLPTTFSLRRISVTVSTRSVAVAPGDKLAGELHADDFGQQHVNRLAEHHAFGLDAADAPADDAQAVDHRRVAIGADERIGERDRPDLVLAEEHDLRQVFEIHLVHDAGARRHDAEIVERLLAPAQEFVPLAVARELHVDVELQRLGELK